MWEECGEFFLTMAKLNIHVNVEVKYSKRENSPTFMELCGNGFEFVLYSEKL